MPIPRLPSLPFHFTNQYEPWLNSHLPSLLKPRLSLAATAKTTGKGLIFLREQTSEEKATYKTRSSPSSSPHRGDYFEWPRHGPFPHLSPNYTQD